MINNSNMLLHNLTITQANEGLINKEFSAEELTCAHLDQICKLKRLNAFITVDEEGAISKAREVNCFDHPLSGVPCAVKDVIVTKGLRSTGGSKILDNYIPPFDATTVAHIKNHDAVILGKANCDSFGHGSANENSDYGSVKNPWDETRVPGGSSGGPAAAVAAGMATYAIGTDTGGSLRHPATWCGLVCIKPTYGRVSRFGLMSFASSTDTVGALTKTAEDAAIVLGAIAGKDKLDATTVNEPVPNYLAHLKEYDIKGMRIGLPKEYFIDGMEPGVDKAVRKAIKELERQGAVIIDVTLPHTEYAIAVYYIITPSETSANLARLDGIRYGNRVERDMLYEIYTRTRSQGFGPETKRRIMIGTYALSSGYYDAYYKKAQKVRTLIIEDFNKVWEEVDILATPVAPRVAFKIGSQTNDPMKMYLEDIFLSSVSLAGLPAVVVPCGIAKPSDGGEKEMPVGLQLIGPQFSEDMLFQVAHTYEQLRGDFPVPNVSRL